MKCAPCDGLGTVYDLSDDDFPPARKKCAPCGGHGYVKPGVGEFDCPECEGRGEVEGQRENAWGGVDDVPFVCLTCAGSGVAMCCTCERRRATKAEVDEDGESLFCDECAAQPAMI